MYHRCGRAEEEEGEYTYSPECTREQQQHHHVMFCGFASERCRLSPFPPDNNSVASSHLFAPNCAKWPIFREESRGQRSH